MAKNKVAIFISYVIILGMLSGCSSLSQQSSLSQSVVSEEAPNVLDGWIYGNNCFDGSYSLCRFNLDGEVANLSNDVPEAIVINNGWIYYSIFPDGKDAFEIYKIKPDGTGREKIVDNAMFREDFYIHNGWLYYQQEYYIPGFEGGLSRVKVDGGNVQKIGDVGLFTIYKDMIYYTAVNEQDENTICRMGLDGSDSIVLCKHDLNSEYSDSIYSMHILNDWIYFVDCNPLAMIPKDKRYIFKLSVNGGQPIPIVETITYGLGYNNEHIYYYDENVKCLNRINIKTDEVEKLRNISFYKFGFYFDWFWYFERSGDVYGKTLNKVKIESLVISEQGSGR